MIVTVHPGLGQLEPAPETRSGWMRGEWDARMLTIIVIADVAAALLADWIIGRRRR